MTLSRREAIGRTAGAVAGLVSFTFCRHTDDDDPPQPQPEPDPQPGETEVKETKIQRLEELYRVAVPCDKYWRLWRGPKDAVVHVTISGGEVCAAVLALGSPEGIYAPVPNLPSAHPNESLPLKALVPEHHELGMQCAGPLNQGACLAIVTGVEPVLPKGVIAGKPQIVQPGGAVTDPETAPPLGSRITVTCGKSSPLWEGKSSYVTVWQRGAATCLAKVATEGEQATDHLTGPQSEVLLTFGPITKLTGSCIGAQAQEGCEFQVVETIELPA